MYPAKSSGSLTSDTAVATRTCVLHSVQLIGDGTNQATVTVYDNASAASGTVLAKIIIDAGLTYDKFTSCYGIEAFNGLFVDVAGTGAEAIIHYTLK